MHLSWIEKLFRKTGPLQTSDEVINNRKPTEELLNAKRYLQHKTPHYAGVIFEDKNTSIALHYLQAPAFEAQVKASLLRAAAITGSNWQIQYGKMVAELRPSGCDKGSTIMQLLQSPSFKGRLPYAFGDVLTDEDMLLAYNRFGGASIRIAKNINNSSATYSIPSPDNLHLFLKSILELPIGTDIFSCLNVTSKKFSPAR